MPFRLAMVMIDASKTMSDELKFTDMVKTDNGIDWFEILVSALREKEGHAITFQFEARE